MILAWGSLLEECKSNIKTYTPFGSHFQLSSGIIALGTRYLCNNATVVHHVEMIVNSASNSHGKHLPALHPDRHMPQTTVHVAVVFIH